MQHTLPTSSVQERSQRVVKFERQVALPAKADSIQPSADSIKPIVNHQSGSPSNTISLSSASSSTSTSQPSPLPAVIPSVSVSSTGGNNFKVNLNQNPSSVEKDGFNFDLSYNKPKYNDPTYKYKDEHSDAHFYNQFPPSVEEPHGYSDYYNNIYNRQQVMEQRPVVTKTIQIAQPAIKAKKYEVRHPAIQKEFYDIEERVVIKPAGTVVVELERPSAKILKEETTLPLGHPHPAVAAAYSMQNRNTQTFSNIIYSNSGSSSPSHSTNQYIPQKTYSGHASTIYDQPTKEINVETSPNKPFIGESHFSASSTDSPQHQSREIVVLTDGHGNQRQLSADQFTYNRDESNKTPSRSVFNQRNSFAYEDNGRSNAQANTTPQRAGFQVTRDNSEDFSFDAEYISNSGNSNVRKETKPARLQETPSERVIEQKKQPQPIIKHEHKIVLSPSQHNIYLSRNQEVPKTKFIEETAEVREIKPYLQNHRGPVVVYSPAKQDSELKYVQRSQFNTPVRVSSQDAQYQKMLQRKKAGAVDSRVQYSAPYAQMRLNSDEDQIQREQPSQKRISDQKSEKLIAEDKQMPEVEKSSKEKSMEKDLPQAHIEIKIPNGSSDNVNKAIFVSSTIRPMMMDDDRDEAHNSKLEISVTNNGEPKKEKPLEEELDINDQVDNDSENKKSSEKETENLDNIQTKPDCDQTSRTALSENYEIASERQQKFMRIVEASSAAPLSSDVSMSSEAGSVQSNLHPNNVDINVKSSAGHISPAGSRVIASTAAPKESSPSESFHKRRIVVNHPFQTVREVVEHEPYTNYHEVQVHEPATPALYHSADYYKPRQADNENSPSYYN